MRSLRKSAMKSFDVLGLNPKLMEKIKALGLTEPTPIPVSYTHLRAHET